MKQLLYRGYNPTEHKSGSLLFQSVGVWLYSIFCYSILKYLYKKILHQLIYLVSVRCPFSIHQKLQHAIACHQKQYVLGCISKFKIKKNKIGCLSSKAVYFWLFIYIQNKKTNSKFKMNQKKKKNRM